MGQAGRWERRAGSSDPFLDISLTNSFSTSYPFVDIHYQAELMSGMLQQ